MNFAIEPSPVYPVQEGRWSGRNKLVFPFVFRSFLLLVVAQLRTDPKPGDSSAGKKLLKLCGDFSAGS
jgi:hypothetical protein